MWWYVQLVFECKYGENRRVMGDGADGNEKVVGEEGNKQREGRDQRE